MHLKTIYLQKNSVLTAWKWIFVPQVSCLVLRF